MKYLKKWYSIAGIGILLLGLYFIFGEQLSSKDTTVPEFTVTEGPLDIEVVSTGELEAQNSITVRGPAGLEAIGIYEIKISTLVPEGKLVKEGEVVAGLDPSEVATKLKEADNEYEKFMAQFTQKRLDTSLTLRQAKDEILNLKYGVKEKEIVLSQSKYEPPATIRQAEMDVEKAKRSLIQAEENFQIKRQQAAAAMQEVGASLNSAKAKREKVLDLIDKLNVKAPANGMLIYKRDWNGNKYSVGKTINTWNPDVATLPDLSVMNSKTFVNEIDIRKVKVNQKVKVGFDAFPEKNYTGTVVAVANVGENKPNSDAKIFEVKIKVDQTDTVLRPAMTTVNRIITKQFQNVVYIPLEAVFTRDDSLKVVYVKNGLSVDCKKVLLGEANDDFVIVEKGVSKGEKVLLAEPEKAKELSVK